MANEIFNSDAENFTVSDIVIAGEAVGQTCQLQFDGADLDVKIQILGRLDPTAEYKVLAVLSGYNTNIINLFSTPQLQIIMRGNKPGNVIKGWCR